MNFQLEVEQLEAANNAKLISNEQLFAAVEQLQLNKDLARVQALDKEVQDTLTQNSLLQSIGDEDSALQIEKNNERLKQLEDDEEVSLNVRLGLKKREIERENNLDKMRFQAAQNSLGQLASLRSSNDKKLAAIGKSSAIAQTTIDTYRGAQGAAAALAPIPIIGPALAVAAAAAFIVAGLARVRTIAGTPLQKGITEVPGVGTRDNFPAMLAPKERVIDANTNQDLKGFLSGNSQMNALLSSIDSKLDRLNNRFVINVGSDKVADVVRDQMQSGRQVLV